MSSDQIRISLVVPAYNEQAALPDLLASVTIARQRYTYGPHAVETVVANNASTDLTPGIAAAHGCRVIDVPERSIARARNQGAKAAHGHILAFVDADSHLHPDTFNVIDSSLHSGVIVGATGIKMSRRSLGIAVTMFVVTIVTRLFRVGSGVIFCRRRDWAHVGGFDETRRHAEDVAFQQTLKRLGTARGQRFAWARGVPTITSARKYDQHGDWHAFALLAYWLRGPAVFRRFVDAYWYPGDR